MGKEICLLLFTMLYLSIQYSYGQEFSGVIKYPYRVHPNVTFLKLGDWEYKADIYQRLDSRTPKPTVIMIHAGGVDQGTKDNMLFMLLPYLDKGWNVINLGPRLPGVTLLPAAIGNCRCALKWVNQNAGKFNFDTTKVVFSGSSGGALLAISAAMSPKTQGSDMHCPGEMTEVAAVVSWHGAYDLTPLLEGSNPYIRQWLRDMPNQNEIASSLSPLPIEDRGVPIYWIHGNEDEIAPYGQSVEFINALKIAGVKAELYTVEGGKHGWINPDETIKIYEYIWKFLDGLGITSE